ncbi:RecT family recombinase [Pseudomonas arsenicoxydans]|uniref:Recombinase RecT n=1 Tax=Pseudomonas arsenicoxydans TaxID=702115 RepID=A0A502HNG4_9PSED|nr:RecT family recombinase [Pseudomonas arsenicoxydans]TPG76339.1 hypothetical protein EAH78_18430 [Pseudomonas arsenicoxydans]
MKNTEQQSTAVQAFTEPSRNAASLILDPVSMKAMTDLADLMANGKTSLPAHFRGNSADCMAIIIQSMQWQMNPFAVAQKTYIVNGGQLSYEAQLINAVITSRAPTEDRLNYEWFGDWPKILGNFRVYKSDKKKNEDGSTKEYRYPNWSIEDEKGLGIRVWATFRGESKPRELETLLLQARTRNSTLWAEDPKQQIAYLATKKWARLHCPDVILGCYTPDEFDPNFYSGEAREINPDSTDSQPSQSSQPKASRDYSNIRAAKPSPDADQALAQLLEIAKGQDIEAYAVAWRALTPTMRARVGKEAHEQLKEVAATVDAEFTDIPHSNSSGVEVAE